MGCQQPDQESENSITPCPDQSRTFLLKSPRGRSLLRMQDFTLSQAYIRFDAVIAAIEPRLRNSTPGVRGYDGSALSRRLSQRLVEVGLNPFVRQAADRHARGLDPFSSQPSTIDCSGLKFDIREGLVTPTFLRWARAVSEFSAQWLRTLLMVIWHAATAPRTAAGKASLLFGVGVEDLAADGSDLRFVRFCRHGPIAPLRDAGRLIIECATEIKSSQADRFRYSRHPLFSLDREFPPGIRELLLFLVEHLAAAAAFFRASTVLPIFCLLARDLAIHALVSRLNRRGAIDSIVITNSNYHVQSLWMRALPGRRFRVHMVWYSQNSIPLVYRSNGVRSSVPNHRHIEVDEIWVWTAGFAGYLKETGVRGAVHVVGPIVWHLPERGHAISEGDDPRLLVFDVTPTTLAFIQKLGLTPRLYFHRLENARKFICDILEVRDELQRLLGRKVHAVLKHKRTPTPFHEHDYVTMVARLADANLVDLVPPETNLYSLIGRSTLVLAIPYSSPVHIAAHMGVPAVYYDPTEELLPIYEAGENVYFASGRSQLQKVVSGLLRSRALTNRNQRAQNE